MSSMQVGECVSVMESTVWNNVMASKYLKSASSIMIRPTMVNEDILLLL